MTLWTRTFARGAVALALALPLSCGDDAGGSTTGVASATESSESAASDSTEDPSAGETEAAGGTETGGATTNMSAGETSTTSTTGGSSSTTEDPFATTTEDPSVDPTSGTEEACGMIEETAEVAPLPTDIIFAIDTSGTMMTEYASVQNNMNAFSSQIVGSGVDAHVVLIAADVMCIDAPLGSGSCPDDSNPDGGYLHINTEVDSNYSLDVIMNTQPEWSGFMRDNARKHIVVVSDDDTYNDPLAFDESFKALGPEYEDYKFHAIVGLWDIGEFLMCAQNPVCCAQIVDSGDFYMTLVELTGGLLGDLCDQEFGPIFDEISTVVVDDAALPCEFVIPDPIEQNLDFDKVNVDIELGGETTPIPKVEGVEGCAEVDDGWYYDDEDAPSQILLCPMTCDSVQGDESAGIDVKFGCQTLIPQ